MFDLLKGFAAHERLRLMGVHKARSRPDLNSNGGTFAETVMGQSRTKLRDNLKIADVNLTGQYKNKLINVTGGYRFCFSSNSFLRSASHWGWNFVVLVPGRIITGN